MKDATDHNKSCSNETRLSVFEAIYTLGLSVDGEHRGRIATHVGLSTVSVWKAMRDIRGGWLPSSVNAEKTKLDHLRDARRSINAAIKVEMGK